MKNKLAVAKHLSDSEYKLLLQVNSEHIRSMGFNERKNYTLLDLVKVERNFSDKCLNVYYENGEWFKYHTDGTWS